MIRNDALLEELKALCTVNQRSLLIDTNQFEYAVGKVSLKAVPSKDLMRLDERGIAFKTVILWSATYQNRKLIPYFPFAELKSLSEEVSRFINEAMPNPPKSMTNMALNFADLLSAKELNQLQKNQEIPIAALSPNVQASMWRIVTAFYIDSLAYFGRHPTFLSAVGASGTLKRDDPKKNSAYSVFWQSFDEAWGVETMGEDSALKFIPCTVVPPPPMPCLMHCQEPR
jgi:hypothetical protein